MRDYSKISPTFWTGETGRKIKAQGHEAVIVAMYLLTSPHSNMIGLYYCPKIFISHETGLDYEGATKGLQRVIEAGFCDYDAPSEMVFVYEMAKYQVGEQLKEKDLKVKGIRSALKNLHKCPFIKEFYDRYHAAFHLEKPRGFEAPSKPLRSQEQEQEQEQEKEQDKKHSVELPHTEPDSESEKPAAKQTRKSKSPLPECRAIAERITQIVSLKKKRKPNKRTSTDWAKTIRLMIDRDEVPAEEINEMLDWYADHWQDDYVPVVECARSLREKFGRLENARSRASRGEPKNGSRGTNNRMPPKRDYMAGATRDEDLPDFLREDFHLSTQPEPRMQAWSM